MLMFSHGWYGRQNTSIKHRHKNRCMCRCTGADTGAGAGALLRATVRAIQKWCEVVVVSSSWR